MEGGGYTQTMIGTLHPDNNYYYYFIFYILKTIYHNYSQQW